VHPRGFVPAARLGQVGELADVVDLHAHRGRADLAVPGQEPVDQLAAPGAGHDRPLVGEDGCAHSPERDPAKASLWAEDIKSKIAAFLHNELRLELSQSKTLITHATSQAGRFLGYEIKAQHSDTRALGPSLIPGCHPHARPYRHRPLQRDPGRGMDQHPALPTPGPTPLTRLPASPDLARAWHLDHDVPKEPS
jgi:hypothetical protein